MCRGLHAALGPHSFPSTFSRKAFYGKLLDLLQRDTLSADNTLYQGFKYDLLIVIIFSDGTGLDDYPDSPGPAHAISSDDANSILDSEEPPQAMDCAAGHSGRPDSGIVQHSAGSGRLPPGASRLAPAPLSHQSTTVWLKKDYQRT